MFLVHAALKESQLLYSTGQQPKTRTQASKAWAQTDATAVERCSALRRKPYFPGIEAFMAALSCLSDLLWTPALRVRSTQSCSIRSCALGTRNYGLWHIWAPGPSGLVRVPTFFIGIRGKEWGQHEFTRIPHKGAHTTGPRNMPWSMSTLCNIILYCILLYYVTLYYTIYYIITHKTDP